ncbi:hypothetical protein R5H32_19900 [Defluviimonas sp. D31]|uniref:DUF6962 family protein n=1 Tax=Defluviimonas sp. D31 TaxID=3083253 RepID=UPI00296EE09D|nr:hypothetical protein [Defluviimonas sp. D31]MDW4551610.1 hypothetical protein [Defluviimonas sp. D31]
MRMLEPDVTLTDFLLATQCATFAVVLIRRRGGNPCETRLFATMYAALALSSLFGALWHGAFSDVDTATGDAVWLIAMAALAASAALLWLISGRLIPLAAWSRFAPWAAAIQFVLQVSVSAYFTDSFIVAALGLLPPMAATVAGYIIRAQSGQMIHGICGAAGVTLAALAGLVIAFDLSLHPRWATTLAVYHAVQFVAFGLVFMSVPATVAKTR